MVQERRVLLVDGSVETEAVLRSALQPKGVTIARIRSGVDAAVLEPSLVVVHDQAASASWPNVPQVVIGKVDVHEPGHDAVSVPAPFEYRDLIATIDRLLSAAA